MRNRNNEYKTCFTHFTDSWISISYSTFMEFPLSTPQILFEKYQIHQQLLLNSKMLFWHRNDILYLAVNTVVISKSFMYLLQFVRKMESSRFNKPQGILFLQSVSNFKIRNHGKWSFTSKKFRIQNFKIQDFRIQDFKFDDSKNEDSENKDSEIKDSKIEDSEFEVLKTKGLHVNGCFCFYTLCHSIDSYLGIEVRGLFLDELLPLGLSQFVSP